MRNLNLFALVICLSILAGNVVHSQPNNFGHTYQTPYSQPLCDIVSFNNFLIGVSGHNFIEEYGDYKLMLISKDNYDLVDSLTISDYKFNKVDLYIKDNEVVIVGSSDRDSTISKLRVNIINKKLQIDPVLTLALPQFYLNEIGRVQSLFLDIYCDSNNEVGLLANWYGNSLLFTIAQDSFIFHPFTRPPDSSVLGETPLHYGRDIKIIDSTIWVVSKYIIDVFDLEFNHQKTFYDSYYFPSAGWIYEWDSFLVHVDHINGFSAFTSKALLTFYNKFTDSSNIKILARDTFGKFEDGILNAAGLNEPVSAYNNGEDLYYCGALGGLFTVNTMESRPIYLVSYNKTLGENWKVEIETDANYGLFGVMTLENGNALIYGHKAKAENNWKAYPFLAEINKEGFVVNSTDQFEHATNKFKLYPNPSKHEVYIRIGEYTLNNIQIAVFDQNGIKVMTKRYRNPETGLDVSSLTPGVYYVSLMSDALKWASKKLIIQ